MIISDLTDSLVRYDLSGQITAAAHPSSTEPGMWLASFEDGRTELVPDREAARALLSLSDARHRVRRAAAAWREARAELDQAILAARAEGIGYAELATDSGFTRQHLPHLARKLRQAQQST